MQYHLMVSSINNQSQDTPFTAHSNTLIVIIHPLLKQSAVVPTKPDENDSCWQLFPPPIFARQALPLDIEVLCGAIAA